MKTIRIFAFPTHGTVKRTSGVDMVRMIQPMQLLDGYKDKEVEFKVNIFDPKDDFKKKDPLSWVNVAKNYDIIYLNYLPDAWGYAAMGAMARSNNRKIVLDTDDSLWDVKKDNVAHSVYHKGSVATSNFTAMCNDVDYMTCSNSYLKNIILNETYKRADKVRVFPNYINLDLYNHKSEFKDTNTITLMHYGSSSHFEDLTTEDFAKGVDKIMMEYPNVVVKFIGAFIPKFRNRWGSRYINAFGHEDIYEWIKGRFREYIDEADIMITPLTEDKYNRCKSSIKFIETASAGKPGVWQDIRQYSEVVKNGENGFLARTQDDWYKAIKTLIEDKKLRKTMGENAFKTVKKDWQIQDHINDYASFFREVYES